ncbi:30S ribosomal protein S15 [Candidatus Shikimatogenerans bostrichidophilus]|uniref:30S ribosomal protein S15 n=1 Tax=Candidatus Shikimatogenerans bostrichidophilus TaxID=2943807 RepID=UPI00296617A1
MKKKYLYNYYLNQINLITNKILNINKHLNNNNKDYNSERILIKKVYKRKKIFTYIKKKYYKIYLTIKNKLKIKE